MKIIETYWMREVAGTYVAVPLKGEARALSSIVNLNESGALLFERLIEGADRETLAKALLDAYDTQPEAAQKAVDQFVARLSDAGLIQK